MHPVLLEMFEGVASHLSGKTVKVELRPPYKSKANGCIYVDHDGYPTIMIRPELWDTDREGFWFVYLHEVAHSLKHASRLVPSDGNVSVNVRGTNFRGQILSIVDGVTELQADTLAVQWREFAGKGPIVARLLKLQRWKPKNSA